MNGPQRPDTPPAVPARAASKRMAGAAGWKRARRLAVPGPSEPRKRRPHREPEVDPVGTRGPRAEGITAQRREGRGLPEADPARAGDHHPLPVKRRRARREESFGGQRRENRSRGGPHDRGGVERLVRDPETRSIEDGKLGQPSESDRLKNPSALEPEKGLRSVVDRPQRRAVENNRRGGPESEAQVRHAPGRRRSRQDGR